MSMYHIPHRLHVVFLLTRANVDPDHVAFASPRKPAVFFEKQEAMEVNQAFGWSMREGGERPFRICMRPKPRCLVMPALDFLPKTHHRDTMKNNA